ncbi:MAG: hypothetical protein HYS22_09160 [Deltaproteobacteria bacterium]|nr:hypothetical protein [Deltaproteobacteria bacterium]
MKIKICKEPGCSNSQTTQSYCRLHYLKNWKHLKEEVRKKAADRLNKYVEGICKKNPEGYVDAVKKDLRNEKSFGRSMDDNCPHDEIDEVLENMGYKDDSSVEQLISNIKIDDDYKS